MVVHEKKETHIHKPFPDGRELSARECEVEMKRIELEYQAKKDNIEYLAQQEELRRKERREADELARKERERRREENRKANRRLLIFGGAVVAGLLGISAYCVYTDSRTPRTYGLPVPEQKKVNAIEAEGSVK